MAVFALGATVVATASAAERGVLTLKEEANTSGESENLANEDKLNTTEKTSITCTKLWVLNLVLTEPGKTHFNLGKDAAFHFSGCKSGATACNSETDEKEVILMLIDMHLVNLLDKEGGKLIPGFFWLVLSLELAATGVLILCGILHFTLRGAMPGVAEPLNAKNVITLTEEVEKVGLLAKPNIVCDKENEKVCDEIKTKEPFECNFGAGFAPCTMETQLITLKVKPDVLWDD